MASEIALATQNVSPFIIPRGGTQFVGELVNPGTVDVANLVLFVELYDDESKFLGGATTLLVGDTLLKGGQRTIWRAVFSRPIETYKDVVIKAHGTAVTPADAATFADKMTVSGVTVSPPASQGTLDGVVVSGTVTNNGNVVALGTDATVGLYDADGKLYAVNAGSVQLWNLAPGLNAPFSTEFTSVKQLPARYEVYFRSLAGTVRPPATAVPTATPVPPTPTIAQTPTVGAKPTAAAATATPTRVAGAGTLTQFVTSRSVAATSDHQAIDLTSQFAVGQTVYLTFTANNVGAGQIVRLKIYPKGQPGSARSSSHQYSNSRPIGTFNDSFTYTAVQAGVFVAELYYEDAVTPSQALTFTVS